MDGGIADQGGGLGRLVKRRDCTVNANRNEDGRYQPRIVVDIVCAGQTFEIVLVPVRLRG
jgi:hypothetical protein